MSQNASRLAHLLHAADPRPDGELLTAFLAGRDETAFAELVRRHGPLVRAACRRILPDPGDADDAFQAAFLVLVRRGHRLDHAQPLGPWLYRVAVLTARTVRRGNARRYARREPMPNLVPAPDGTTDLRTDLDTALMKLPEKYRTPLILCHLQGWSRHEAAERLGYREGTLSSLLARGLVKLRDRLRGYDPAAALTVATAAVPTALAAATTTAALGAGAAPAAVRLADGFVRAAFMKKVSNAVAATAALVGIGFGAASVALAPPPAGSETRNTGPARLVRAERTPLAPEPRLAAGAPPAPADLRRIAVCVGGPLGAVPLRTDEIDPHGVATGRRRWFTSVEQFEGYMARLKADATAPKLVQVDVWEYAHTKHAQKVFKALQSAGYTSVVVRGWVPVVGPVARIVPDDELLMDLTDLVPADQVGAAAGGGNRPTLCGIKPTTCRSPAARP